MYEKVRWPWWLTLLIFAFDFSIVIVIWASLGNIAAVIATLTTIALTVFFWFFTSLGIRTDDDSLHVGRAHIEKQYLRNPEILTRDQLTFFLRTGFKPSAFYAVRFWIKTGIKIEVIDPRDPTPFWIVTCKKGTEIERWIKA